MTPSLLSPTNIFAPVSTPADSIFGLSLFVLGVTGRHIRGRLQPAGLRRREIQKQAAMTIASHRRSTAATRWNWPGP